MKKPEKSVNLGHPELSLKVDNLQKSLAFYQKLGFETVEGNADENWLVVEHNGLRIGLYQGHIERNLITFHDGDVNGIAEGLAQAGVTFATGPEIEPDQSIGATIFDPDGNAIYLNTRVAPEECKESDAV